MNLRVCQTERDRLASFSIRSIVFISEQKVPFDEEFDEHDTPDSAAINIVGWRGHEAIAAGRIRYLDDVAKLERICIRSAWRGGTGHQLVEFMMGVATAAGYSRFTLNAQAHLTDFYAKHGFVAQGEIFLDAGIDHLLMTRD